MWNKYIFHLFSPYFHQRCFQILFCWTHLDYFWIRSIRFHHLAYFIFFCFSSFIFPSFFFSQAFHSQPNLKWYTFQCPVFFVVLTPPYSKESPLLPSYLCINVLITLNNCIKKDKYPLLYKLGEKNKPFPNFI